MERPRHAENPKEMSHVRLFVLGAAVLCTVPVSAQSLADMAKRAEQQRSAANGKSTRLELDTAQELRTLPLNRPEVETYVGVRVALAQLWHLDPPLYERVRGGSLSARSVTEWSKAFEAEPAVMKVMNRFKYSPEALLAMTKSLEEATRLGEGGFEMSALSPVQRQNWEFAGTNSVWLGVMRTRIARAEAGRSIWR
jgi:hypothetical protein